MLVLATFKCFWRFPGGEALPSQFVVESFLEHSGEYFNFKFFQYVGRNEFYIGSSFRKNLPLNEPHNLGGPGATAHVHLELDGIDNSRSAKGFVCLERGGDYPKGVIYCAEEKAFSLIAMFDFKNS